MRERFIPQNLDISNVGNVIIKAAQAGGRAILESSTEEKATKSGKFDLVTEADQQSNEAIERVIKASSSQAQILSEEVVPSRELNYDEELYVVDPLDGTLNASLGLQHSAVSIAYAQNGHVRAGVIFNPFTDDFFFAERGKGAYKNGERIRVSKTKDLNSALVWTDSVRDKKLRQLNIDILQLLNPEFGAKGSITLNIANVAGGKVDLYFCKGYTGPWDIAAAVLLIKEAGGVVYDLSGNDLTNQSRNFLTSDIVVGNKTLVKQFTNAVRPIMLRFKKNNPSLFEERKEL